MKDKGNNCLGLMLSLIVCVLLIVGCGGHSRDEGTGNVISIVDSNFVFYFGSDSNKSIRCLLGKNGVIQVLPEWPETSKFRIDFSEEYLSLTSYIAENQSYVRKFPFSNKEKSYFKKYVWSQTDKDWTIASIVEWVDMNTVYEMDNNLMAFHVLPSDSLDYGSESFIKLHCVDFEDWATIFEVKATNSNGVQTLYKGEVKDFRKIPITFDCSGEWKISSVVLRIDTVFNQSTRDSSIHVIRDTLNSNLYVRGM